MGGAGWFDDDEHPGRQRYWDGDRWTDRTRPSTSAESSRLATEASGRHIGPSPEELRQREWTERFPIWDVAVPREGEPGYPAETAGGAASWDATFAARFASRIGYRRYLRRLLVLLIVWIIVATVVFSWLILVKNR